MQTALIRQRFIEYFSSKGHQHVPSSSLVPYQDPSILFTNAGMNQFKQYFLLQEKPPYSRAVTFQKVLRAGGKHNDLENVGYTNRHHTFFEMLGNFSFGDYFKLEAIQFAWEFLTKELNINPDCLAVSVFEKDDEAYKIWNEKIGLTEDRIARLGEKDNFWSMGDVGPCGPCSEIHYSADGAPAGKTAIECLQADDGTFLEIWNLVFMQFEKTPTGQMVDLPKPSVDTGMGLERIAAVLQGASSNYETDLLFPLIQAVQNSMQNTTVQNTIEPAMQKISCRVIADHIRAAAFLIADGVVPSNEKQGYVLRRIIRRATLHGQRLGLELGFFANLLDTLIPMMQDVFPELTANQKRTADILNQEEQQFNTTLSQGLRILNQWITQAKQAKKTELSGEQIFTLYDTYGFPLDLSADVLKDHQLSYDQLSFKQHMQAQRTRAKQAQAKSKADPVLYRHCADYKNQFVGHTQLNTKTQALALLQNGQLIEQLKLGDTAEILLEKTPFYPEGGGQIGDQGWIKSDQFTAEVKDSFKATKAFSLSRIHLTDAKKGFIALEDLKNVQANVFEDRFYIANNHSATHLLHAALHQILGKQAKQAGSLVNQDRLRFDFQHSKNLEAPELEQIETLVNQWIGQNKTIHTQQMQFEQAIQKGAMALFNEKYDAEVRVVQIGDFSLELCGGCHAEQTGQIGFFKILSSSTIAAGVCRIEALTSRSFLQWVQQQSQQFNQIAKNLHSPKDQVLVRLAKLQHQFKNQEQQIRQLQNQLVEVDTQAWLDQAENLNGIGWLCKEVQAGFNMKLQAEKLTQQMSKGAILLYQQQAENKILVILALGTQIVGKLHAGQLIQKVAPLIGGRGGGNAVFAQCGGSNSKGIKTLQKTLQQSLQEA